MAYKDKKDYSPFAHGHDYTDFWYFPSYGPQSNNVYVDSMGQVIDYRLPISCQTYGRFDITKYFPGKDVYQTYQISACGPNFQASLIDQTNAYKPKKVGDLQMLAFNCTFYEYLANYRHYSIVDGNVALDSRFDGYVIPNGKTYTCARDEFKDACRVYGTGENATSFTVPNLYSFVKANPGDYGNAENRFNGSIDGPAGTAIEKRSGQTGLASHTHAGINTDYTINPLQINGGQFYQYTSDTFNGLGGAEDNFAHGAYTNKKASKQAYVQLTRLQLNAQVTMLQIYGIGNSIESYPSHALVPTLIYIGER